MTKQEFCNHYYKVFTEDGKVKPCGRNMCIQLIEICNEISAPPGREPLFYGDARTGMIQIDKIQKLMMYTELFG